MSWGLIQDQIAQILYATQKITYNEDVVSIQFTKLPENNQVKLTVTVTKHTEGRTNTFHV